MYFNNITYLMSTKIYRLKVICLLLTNHLSIDSIVFERHTNMHTRNLCN